MTNMETHSKEINLLSLSKHPLTHFPFIQKKDTAREKQRRRLT